MHHLVLEAVVVIGLGSLGCQAAAPVGAPPPPPRSSVDAAPAPAPAPAAATTAADPCLVVERAERADLRRCPLETPPTEWSAPGVIAITASPATVRATPGGIGDLVVHYTNTTDAPVVLVFDDTPTRGHVVAHRADGRRADGTEAPPPAWARVTPRFQRITLAPRAVLDERRMWFASSWRWAASDREKEFPRSLLGPLSKGPYTLHVRTQLVVGIEGDRLAHAEAITAGVVE